MLTMVLGVGVRHPGVDTPGFGTPGFGTPGFSTGAHVKLGHRQHSAPSLWMWSPGRTQHARRMQPSSQVEGSATCPLLCPAPGLLHPPYVYHLLTVIHPTAGSLVPPYCTATLPQVCLDNPSELAGLVEPKLPGVGTEPSGRQPAADWDLVYLLCNRYCFPVTACRALPHHLSQVEIPPQVPTEKLCHQRVPSKGANQGCQPRVPTKGANKECQRRAGCQRRVPTPRIVPASAASGGAPSKMVTEMVS